MKLTMKLAGALMMLYAVVGAFLDLGGKAGGVLIFLVAVLVLHDAIWMPLVLLAGKRIKRPRTRVVAIVATAVTVTALPLALGLGRTADNPSALPLHYGRNLIILLLVIGLGLLSRKDFTIRRRGKGR
jgi:hypothetical protein